jgi:hypothetical protein
VRGTLEEKKTYQRIRTSACPAIVLRGRWLDGFGNDEGGGIGPSLYQYVERHLVLGDALEGVMGVWSEYGSTELLMIA